jgi:hypothetical protein
MQQFKDHKHEVMDREEQRLLSFIGVKQLRETGEENWERKSLLFILLGFYIAGDYIR